MFATIYGGFLSSPLFRDIDIGVFTGYKIGPKHVEEYTEDLGKVLKNRATRGIVVDIRVVKLLRKTVLNYGFLYFFESS